MIILFSFGQTCNKFFQYSNAIADAIEFKTKCYVLAPDITILDYPNLLESKYIKFPFFSQKLAALFGMKIYINFLTKIFENKYSRRFIIFLFNYIKSVDVVDTYDPTKIFKSQFRMNHKKDIIKMFEPNHGICQRVGKLFLNKPDYLIIGIHVRRGDYKYFMEGRYFYSIENYKVFMNKIEKIFPNEKIRFFLSSNENISLSDFQDFDIFNIPNSSATMDLKGLSLCNYISGPPSTYSGWASFMGNVPLKFVENYNDNFFKIDFQNILSIWGNETKLG